MQLPMQPISDEIFRLLATRTGAVRTRGGAIIGAVAGPTAARG